MGDTPTQTYEKIRKTMGEGWASRSLVFSWFKCFSGREEVIDDKEKTGRSKKSVMLMGSVKRFQHIYEGFKHEEGV